MALKKKSKPVRLVVTGAHGRMGRRILALAADDKRFQIMAGVERPGSGLVGRFTENGQAPIVGNIAEVLHNADAVIDFSSPEAAIHNAKAAAAKKTAFVLGTTGLKTAQVKQLKNLSRRTPIVFSPNMASGVNLLFRLVQLAAKAIPEADIEIVEAHHNLKKDAPSGTAMRLAELAAIGSGRSMKDVVTGRHGQVGARKKKEIGVLAVRAGDIVGDHTVLLAAGGERLELTHRAHSRDAFASGALDAAAWAAKKRSGFFTMFDVLNI